MPLCQTRYRNCFLPSLTSVLLLLKFLLGIATKSPVLRGFFHRPLECSCPSPAPYPSGLTNVSSAFLCRLVRHIGEAEELTLVFMAWEGLFVCWTFIVDMCNHALPFSFSSKLLAPGYSETYYNSSGKEVTTSPQIMVKQPPRSLNNGVRPAGLPPVSLPDKQGWNCFYSLGVTFFSNNNNYLIDLLTLLYFPKNDEG